MQALFNLVERGLVEAARENEHGALIYRVRDDDRLDTYLADDRDFGTFLRNAWERSKTPLRALCWPQSAEPCRIEVTQVARREAGNHERRGAWPCGGGEGRRR